MKTNRLVFIALIMALMTLDFGASIFFEMLWMFFLAYVWKTRVPNEVKARFFL